LDDLYGVCSPALVIDAYEYFHDLAAKKGWEAVQQKGETVAEAAKRHRDTSAQTPLQKRKKQQLPFSSLVGLRPPFA